ncbi:MAG: spore germination protein [Heliobacteriaceae bacterium]|nr:spore germination protein [Heliobacteriaceae bacterium]
MPQATPQVQLIDARLAVNVNRLQGIFVRSDDFQLRRLTLNIEQTGVPVVLACFPGLTDQERLAEIIALLQEIQEDISRLLPGCLPVGKIKKINRWSQVKAKLLSGWVVLFVEGSREAYCFPLPAPFVRSPDEPVAEQVVRGPHNGFVEDIEKNLALVRQRMRSTNLKVELFQLGRLSATRVALIYGEGIIDPAVLAEVKHRLVQIDVDDIKAAGTIEEFIEDHPLSIFPQILHTERPDRVTTAIASGAFAVIVDGTPMVLLAPVTFVQFFHSPEDEYERYYYGTFVRLLRYLAIPIALLLPSLYVALTTFNSEMIPTQLLFSIATARAGIPFPAMVEAFLMEATFELLREAGIRLPRQVGQAVSIVGALVIGEGAVRAGIVSQGMVIVVALTGMASFGLPAFNQAQVLRMLRFPLLLLGGTAGILGVFSGVLVLLLHLLGLRSFGVPYFSPLSPLELTAWKSQVLRFPVWAIGGREDYLGTGNKRRLGKQIQRRRYKWFLPGDQGSKQPDPRDHDLVVTAMTPMSRLLAARKKPALARR